MHKETYLQEEATKRKWFDELSETGGYWNGIDTSEALNRLISLSTIFFPNYEEVMSSAIAYYADKVLNGNPTQAERYSLGEACQRLPMRIVSDCLFKVISPDKS